MFPQLPVESQSCPWFETHCFVSGEQTPEHAPPVQIPAQTVATQLPVLSHVRWRFVHEPPLLTHSLVPGTQTPEQRPAPEQTNGHVVASFQLPVKSQVCEVAPEHRVTPGVQTPTQLPEPVQA
jgi:hypothetical protein